MPTRRLLYSKAVSTSTPFFLHCISITKIGNINKNVYDFGNLKHNACVSRAVKGWFGMAIATQGLSLGVTISLIRLKSKTMFSNTQLKII